MSSTDLKVLAHSIADSISDRLHDSIRGWQCSVFYRPPWRSDARPYAVWTSSFTVGKVIGTVDVTWGVNLRGAYIVKSKWTFKPHSFTTRQARAHFISITEEMNKNAPKVEAIMREEISMMGDPVLVLAKKARKSAQSPAEVLE